MSKSTGDTVDKTLDDIDWTEILEEIEERKCVLFLGSGIYQLGDSSLDQEINQWLGLPNPEHPSIKVHNLYNDDGFILLKKNNAPKYKRKVSRELSAFYSQSFPDTEILLSRIARIPFHLIINVAPDNLLARTFDRNGLDYEHSLYRRNEESPSSFTKPTGDRPLIYSLLGNIEDPNSLVLTHQDFFDYLKSIFKGDSMHQDLKNILEEAERFIFLGLPYEKWHFQLLLRVLSLQLQAGKLEAVERLGLKEFEDEGLNRLYTEEFKIEFIPFDVDVFVDRLYQECSAKAERENSDFLKEIYQEPEVTNELISVKELREYLENDNLKETLLNLKTLLISHKPKPAARKLLDKWLLLHGRYKRLSDRENAGAIRYNDLSTEQGEIAMDLLELINETANL